MQIVSSQLAVRKGPRIAHRGALILPEVDIPSEADISPWNPTSGQTFSPRIDGMHLPRRSSQYPPWLSW